MSAASALSVLERTVIQAGVRTSAARAFASEGLAAFRAGDHAAAATLFGQGERAASRTADLLGRAPVTGAEAYGTSNLIINLSEDAASALRQLTGDLGAGAMHVERSVNAIDAMLGVARHNVRELRDMARSVRVGAAS
ncbi:MAG: hypothetical protein H7287_12670 [Thermoleophilia bacterium]|nr:hypothetical protein [Thermoleophilia bacterium]